MTHHGDCRSALKRQATGVLSANPDLNHRWTETPDALSLEFPRIDVNGFDVVIKAFEPELFVVAGRMHSHYDWHSTADEACTDALGFARDLLSRSMRLVEESAGGTPYRWHLESFIEGQWQREETYGLLIFNYVGRRSSRVLQNNQLASRSVA